MEDGNAEPSDAPAAECRQVVTLGCAAAGDRHRSDNKNEEPINKEAANMLGSRNRGSVAGTLLRSHSEWH